MAKNKAVPSMVQSDGTLKRIISYDYTERNYRRIFLNQALPALGLFANRATKILLYIIQNADSSNIVHCTYKDIMRDCEIKDKRIVTKTLKEMQEAEIIVKISQSRYMLNPARHGSGQRPEARDAGRNISGFPERKKTKCESEGGSKREGEKRRCFMMKI